MKQTSQTFFALLSTFVCLGCVGLVGAQGSSEQPPVGVATISDAGTDGVINRPVVRVPGESVRAADALGETPLRRITREEFRSIVLRALGVDASDLLRMAYPNDTNTPFDNDAVEQAGSTRTLVQGIDVLADDLSRRALSTPALRARNVPCTPTGPGDAACFRTFVQRVGSTLARRALTDDEVAPFVTSLVPYSTQQNDFFVGARLALRALLQDPEWLYRVEIGTAVAGRDTLVRLTPSELASRLSFLLWGTSPDEALLMDVTQGRLATPEGVRAIATRMLADPRAVTQMARFHAMWLGYQNEQRLPTSLAVAMRAESDRLVQRVVFDDRQAWRTLFTSEQTFVTSALAMHYGLTAPANAMGDWVPYGDSSRRGILSHATVLAASSPKPGDTSPTQRGIFVRTRLLCETINLPDAATLQSNVCTTDADCTPGSRCRMVDAGRRVCVVDIDRPPPGDACKIDRYRAHARGACAGCHARVDSIGFGLERFGLFGQERSHDDGRPTCTLDGQGNALGLGRFEGPRGLGTLIAASPQFERCAVTQLYRYIQGRHDATGDVTAIDRLAQELVVDRSSLRDLMLELVSSEAFRHRVLPSIP
jgi:hypothetical protein